MFMNTQDHFGLIARLLHWLIAALAIGMLVGGGLLSILPSGGFKAVAISGHKSIGVVIFLLMTGFFTFMLGGFFERNEASLTAFFMWHPWLYLFLVPAVGMRLWSEEKRQGTIELLLTMPITPWQAKCKNPSCSGSARTAVSVAR